MLHWRKDSGELEVFEAANYFAEASNNNNQLSSCINYNNAALTFSHKIITEGCNNNHAHNYKPQLKQGTPSQIMENSSAALKQKCKQPRSPTRMLTSCLSILFYQTVSSKNNNKKKNKLMISTATKDNEDATNSSSYINPRNSCKRRPEKKIVEFSGTEISKINVHHWADKIPSEENEYTKFGNDNDDDDDDDDSDTSSDLFDLPNNELLLDCSLGGLPVYRTTQMNTIKIKSGEPISILPRP